MALCLLKEGVSQRADLDFTVPKSFPEFKLRPKPAYWDEDDAFVNTLVGSQKSVYALFGFLLCREFFEPLNLREKLQARGYKVSGMKSKFRSTAT